MSDDIRERLAYVAIKPVPHAHLCRDARREIDRLISRNRQLFAALMGIAQYDAYFTPEGKETQTVLRRMANEALSAEPEQGEPAEGELCPVCEKGTLTRIECCVCDTCDANPVLSDQILRNDGRLGVGAPDGGEGALDYDVLEALDDLDDLVKFALESPRFCVDNPSSIRNPHRLADNIRRALREPRVPEAVVRVAREALSCCGCSPAERDSGHKIGCPVPQLQDELDRALAQPEQGRVPQWVNNLLVAAARQYRHNDDNSPDMANPRQGFVVAYDRKAIGRLIDEIFAAAPRPQEGASDD